MYKISVEFKDFVNDNKLTKADLYFHLTAYEFAKLAAAYNGPKGFAEYMTEAFSDEANYKDGFAALQSLFRAAYGRRLKPEDGTDRYRFLKKPEWVDELESSPEFESAFLRLSTDATFAAKFWRGIVSEELLAQAQQMVEAEASTEPPKKFQDMTTAEKAAAMQTKVAGKKKYSQMTTEEKAQYLIEKAHEQGVEISPEDDE